MYRLGSPVETAARLGVTLSYSAAIYCRSLFSSYAWRLPPSEELSSWAYGAALQSASSGAVPPEAEETLQEAASRGPSGFLPYLLELLLYESKKCTYRRYLAHRSVDYHRWLQDGVDPDLPEERTYLLACDIEQCLSETPRLSTWLKGCDCAAPTVDLEVEASIVTVPLDDELLAGLAWGADMERYPLWFREESGGKIDATTLWKQYNRHLLPEPPSVYRLLLPEDGPVFREASFLRGVLTIESWACSGESKWSVCQITANRDRLPISYSATTERNER